MEDLKNLISQQKDVSSDDLKHPHTVRIHTDQKSLDAIVSGQDLSNVKTFKVVFTRNEETGTFDASQFICVETLE